MTRKEYIERAAHAHSTLNVFSAVVALLENGLLYGGGTTASRIIALAKREGAYQLKIYDKAVESALKR